MTKTELEQLRYINGEIAMWQEELRRLRESSMIRVSVLSHTPKGGKGREMADIAVQIADYEKVIEGLLKKAQLERGRILTFIEGIEDSLMKQIVFYRHVSCFTWREIAAHMGYGNTEDSLRMAYNRFFRKG